MANAEKKPQVIIKKYANRRLYDTTKSAYVTLEDLCKLVQGDVEFNVVDAQTDEDLTRSVLTQIIAEQEAKGYSLLPINFLRNIIKFYNNSLRSVLPPYLETMMDQFTKNQEQMQTYVGGMDKLSPFKQFQDIGRQNMDLFEKTMSMWTQFNPIINPLGDKGKKES